MIVKKTTVEYYCTFCGGEVEGLEIKKCSKCGEHGCNMCIRKCGDGDEDEDCRVKGCHKLFCQNCYDLSPWDASYCLLCYDCIEKQNVGQYYGPEVWDSES
jgi:hypothetical protein